jgi:hypothetical protein
MVSVGLGSFSESHLKAVVRDSAGISGCSGYLQGIVGLRLLSSRRISEIDMRIRRLR